MSGRFHRPDGTFDRAACMRHVANTTDARALRWRGKLEIPAGCHPFVRLLFREMNRQRICLHEVAARAGVRYDTISMWRYKANPQLQNLAACLQVVGFDLRPVRILEKTDAAF